MSYSNKIIRILVLSSCKKLYTNSYKYRFIMLKNAILDDCCKCLDLNNLQNYKRKGA